MLEELEHFKNVFQAGQMQKRIKKIEFFLQLKQIDICVVGAYNGVIETEQLHVFTWVWSSSGFLDTGALKLAKKA